MISCFVISDEAIFAHCDLSEIKAFYPRVFCTTSSEHKACVWLLNEHNLKKLTHNNL